MDGRVLSSSQTGGKRRAELGQRLSVGCAISEFVFSDVVLTERFRVKGDGRKRCEKANDFHSKLWQSSGKTSPSTREFSIFQVCLNIYS